MSDPRYSERAIIQNLRTRTFCRLGISKVSGIGVLAIKKIPVGTDPFQTVYKLDTTPIDLTQEEVESLDPGVKRLVKDFFMLTVNDRYPVFYNGMNALDIAYYLNHSDNPNVMMVYEEDSNVKDQYYTFKTIKEIKVGDELTINYYQHATSLEDVEAIQKQFRLP